MVNDEMRLVLKTLTAKHKDCSSFTMVQRKNKNNAYANILEDKEYYGIFESGLFCRCVDITKPRGNGEHGQFDILNKSNRFAHIVYFVH